MRCLLCFIAFRYNIIIFGLQPQLKIISLLIMNRNYKYLLKFFIITLVFIHSVISNASTYYVATNGVDIPANGTFLSPFLTIQYGSNQLLAGDSLIVRGGTYFESVYLNTSGSTLMPITIAAYPNEIPLIDGTGASISELFIISSRSNVTIDGLTFQNKYGQNAKGIYVLGEGDNISITNCEIRNIGWTSDADADPYSVDPTGQAHGILVNGRTTTGITNISITNCKIHDIVTGNSEALTLVGNISGFEIAYTDVYDTKNIGIDVAGHYSWAVDSGVDPTLNQSRDGSVHHCEVYNNKRVSNTDAPAGIYADGARDVVIHSNIVYNNGNGFSIGCENAGFTASNITVVNNLVYANDNQGVYFGSNASNITDCILKNNTIVENGTIGPFYSEISLQNSTDCIIAQNILIPRISSNYAISIFGYTASSLTVDNNLAYRYGGDLTNIFIPGTPTQFTDTNSTFINPSFTDSLIASLDIILKSESVAIDKGSSTYQTYNSSDLYDSYRTVNGKLDLGATEALMGSCPEILTIDDTFTLNGVFTAQDSVIIDLDQVEILDSIIIRCPITKVTSSSINSTQLILQSEGCINE